MGKLFAKTYDYQIQPNQEFLAIGATNIISSFFSCFTSSASLSRSLVQANVGGTTQLASIVSSIIILIFILALGNFLQPLPTCVLAAIVIVNLKGMFKQFSHIPRFWRLCKIDAVTWVVAFLGTFLIDVDIGLYIGVGFVLLTLLVRTAQTKYYLAYQVPDSELFQDVEKSKNLQNTNPLIVIKWPSPIYFANAEKMGETIRQTLREEMDKVTTSGDVESTTSTMDLRKPTHIILDLSGSPFIDSTGINLLRTVTTDLDKGEVAIILVNCPGHILRAMKADEVMSEILSKNAFVSVIDAKVAIESGKYSFWSKLKKGEENVNDAEMTVLDDHPATEIGEIDQNEQEEVHDALKH